MRVDKIQNDQTVQQSRQSTAPKSTGADNAFNLLLQSEISGSGAESVSNDATSGTRDLSGPLSIQSFMPIGVQAAEASDAPQASQVPQALDALDGALTQLDSLSNALRQNKSPKEINALLEQVNATTAGLDDKMSGLPADHPLKGMAEELKVTTYMESLKWNRGDYL